MEFSLTGDIDVRRARRADLDAIEDLETRAFAGNRLSRRALAYHCRNPRAALLVALMRATFAGYALVLFRPGAAMARLYSIASEPTTRGIGRALLAAGETESIRRGYNALRLEVRADNHAAIRFYEKAGYRCFGHSDSYYEDGCAALRYERPIGRAERG